MYMAGRAITSRVTLQRSQTPLLDGAGYFELKVPSWTDIQLQLGVNETSRLQYDVCCQLVYYRFNIFNNICSVV